MLVGISEGSGHKSFIVISFHLFPLFGPPEGQRYKGDKQPFLNFKFLIHFASQLHFKGFSERYNPPCELAKGLKPLTKLGSDVKLFDSNLITNNDFSEMWPKILGNLINLFLDRYNVVRCNLNDLG